MQDLSVGTAWLHSLFLGFMPEWLAVTLECLLIGVGLMLLYAVLALFYILFERKVCAYFQCRLGPNRVGPWGLLQSVADMFKILIKELISLNHIDKFLFALAPYLVIIASMLAFAVLPGVMACRSLTSMSEFSSCLLFRQSVCLVSFWPVGHQTTSSLSSVRFVQVPRWSAMSFRWVCASLPW